MLIIKQKYMIPVTKPFFPPLKEYQKYLEGIWEREWLTNMGPLANQLEQAYKDYFQLEQLLFVTNGTIAIQMAIKALGLRGEIITTPFSFVATTSSIVWEGCKPVFVDIDAETLNIDPSKIEAAITENTSAILATHVYGNPCDVEAIDKIAKKHNLKVIYDAAHAFGVKIKGKSIFEYGDISTLSLHATKMCHTVEGGLVITKDSNLLEKMKRMRNFGISGPESFTELGVNAKNSEIHAAMGLVTLKYAKEIVDKRDLLMKRYDKNLKKIKAKRPIWHVDSENLGAYYAIIFDEEKQLHHTIQTLSEHNIGTRRYFYPSLASALPYLDPIEMPITEDISKRVLCLPMYHDLSVEEVDKISDLINTL